MRDLSQMARTEYSLTKKGRGLSHVFDAMAKFGEKWLD